MPITKATASSIAPAAKGDLVVGSATNDAAVLGVGSNDQVLTADSSTATGLKWATPSAGGLTLISTTSLTGSTVNLTSIPGTYKHLQLIITEAYTTGDCDFELRLNNDSGATSYTGSNIRDRAGTLSSQFLNNVSLIRLGVLRGASTATERFSMVLDIPRYTDTGQNAMVYWRGRTQGDAAGSSIGAGYYRTRTAAITQINLLPGTDFVAGTAYLYGVS